MSPTPRQESSHAWSARSADLRWELGEAEGGDEEGAAPISHSTKRSWSVSEDELSGRPGAASRAGLRELPRSSTSLI
jgi:hypothetical protein